MNVAPARSRASTGPAPGMPREGIFADDELIEDVDWRDIIGLGGIVLSFSNRKSCNDYSVFREALHVGALWITPMLGEGAALWYSSGDFSLSYGGKTQSFAKGCSQV